jgi:putative transposase
VYASWGIAPKRVDRVKETYRRFGIETSYRQRNQCRIRTTTKKFPVRFLDVAIGLWLRNLWVWLHHCVLSSPRRGGRRYHWELLRVERMLLWLEEVAKSMYGLVVTIPTERYIPESVPS